MGLVTWGSDEQAVRKTVYYEGTSTPVGGMPVCYNWDTTDNWHGYGEATLGAAPTEQGTTAEGEHNEGKYIRVEDPATANIQWFAGVICNDSINIGTSGGACTVEIFVPNGAIVPVLASVECTVGRTVLAINNAATTLGHATTSGRPIAVAMETNATLDTTNGVVLAKLDPSLFLYQVNANTALLAGTGATAAAATQILNTINVSSGHTAGEICPFFCIVDCTGAIAAAGGAYGALYQLTVSGSHTSTGYFRTILANANLTGTINGGVHIASVMAQLGGSPTFTWCEHVQCLWADASLGTAPTTGTYSIIKMTNNGANQTEVHNAFYIRGGYGINKLFYFDTCDGITGNFISNGGTGGATKVITSGGDWKKVKCSIEGTDYFMILMVDPSEIDNT